MLYKCKICLKEFKQKSNYTDHLNRIKPCVKLTDESSKNPQITSNLLKINSKTLKKICHYCGYETERKDNYNRHLLSCKIRKRDIEEKEEILNKLLEQNNKLESTIHKQQEQIQQLIKTNENLMNHMKIKQNNKNVKHQNNGTINNINIIQFGKEDLSKIDNKEFFEALTEMGYKIPAKMVEKIHINDKYPEYKNIYISDINRGKAMVHDGKKWKLERYDKISDKLLDKILNFMEERYEDIKDNKNITEKRKMNMENKLKILQIMKDYEEEEEKERHEYLRNQCKDKIKMDLYNNREGDNPKAEEDGKS
jgi:hypothetical protein